jgi:toxin ParE1/3/4
MAPLWTVEFSQKAATDFDDIILNTLHSFGHQQANRYSRLISQSIQALSESGPRNPLAKNRPELGAGIQSIHIQRLGQKARHILFFKVLPDKKQKTIVILRLLHEAMDFDDHL